jgi:hypothetical protein
MTGEKLDESDLVSIKASMFLPLLFGVLYID